MKIDEDRLGVVAAFYNLPQSVIADIGAIPKDDRKPLCAQHGVNRSVLRTMLDYDRYPQARDVHALLLKNGERIEGLSMLDFGCLVADYAIYFARLGARAAVYDDDEATRFAAFRFAREGLPLEIQIIPTAGEDLMAGRDLVVFGEVLEHVDDPIALIRDCIKAKVRYVFTSCYPFGDDDYFALSGHLKSAQDLQPECIRVLSTHFDAIPSSDKSVLWKRRENQP